MTAMTERPFPADLDAERAVLGSVLLNREAIVPIAPWLRVAHFYTERHAWIYEAMLTCYDRSSRDEIAIDFRTVADELRKRSRLDAVGGYPFLAGLIDCVPVSSHVEYYARIVERMAVARAVIIAGGQIAALGYDESADPDTMLAKVQHVVDMATERPATDDTLVPLSDVVKRRYDAISAAMERGEPVQLGLLTGLRDLDELTGGLRKSDLLILAARPSVGKSSLALTLAANVAAQGRRVDIFSLEMSRDQVLDRLIAMDTGMNLMQVRDWRLSEDELRVYLESMGRMDALPIAIDEQAALSVRDIRSRILRRSAQLGKPELVIIDYLQLMNGSKRSENRVQEVSEISRSLKVLAKELDAPVLALSQLSRAVEGRASHVPMLSDLRESGSIEQDADIVMFIYREELYDKDTDKIGIAELYIAKQRNGPIGVVPMRFDANTTRFMDLTWRTTDGY